MMFYLARCMRYFPRLRFNSIKWDVIVSLLQRLETNEKTGGMAWADLGHSAKFLDERPVEYFEVFNVLKLHAGSNASVLDAGSVLNFQRLVPFMSSLKKVSIFTLAPEAHNAVGENLSFSYGDLRDMPFENESFHCVVSISTLEHVGLDNTKLYSNTASHKEYNPDSATKAVEEMWRVVQKGGTVLISVPYGKAAVYDWLRIFDENALSELYSTTSWGKVERRFYRNGSNGWTEVDADNCLDAGYSSPLTEGKYTPNRPGAEAVAILELTK